MTNKTQLTILATLAIALTAGSAFADFRPGRVRAGAYSEMRTTEASGIYERETGARLEMNYEDGKSDPVSLTLKMEGKQPETFEIQSIQRGFCGDQLLAVSAPSIFMRGTTVKLTDYSNIRCRIAVRNAWHLDVSTFDEDHLKSEWKLEGQPEYLAVTLTTRR